MGTRLPPGDDEIFAASKESRSPDGDAGEMDNVGVHVEVLSRHARGLAEESGVNLGIGNLGGIDDGLGHVIAWLVEMGGKGVDKSVKPSCGQGVLHGGKVRQRPSVRCWRRLGGHRLLWW